MSNVLLLIAILVSLLFGYVIADWQGKQLVRSAINRWVTRHIKKGVHSKDSRYYGVLTKLLNEQPDEALDHFIQALDVNAETLEMHLALGGLLRRRGEFDRAVRVHQHLLTRPGLPTDSIHKVQLELACDYWRSGLLDRAEALLKELMAVVGVHRGTRWQAAAYLVEIYQDLGDWLAAIDVADQLTAKKFADEPDFWRELQAHFCCELAEHGIASNDVDEATRQVRKALSYDPECVRAYLLRAHISLTLNDRRSALVSLEHVVLNDPSYLSETCDAFAVCLEGDDWLCRQKDFQQKYPSLKLVCVVVDALILKQDVYAAFAFLGEELPRLSFSENELSLLDTLIQPVLSKNLDTISFVVTDVGTDVGTELDSAQDRQFANLQERLLTIVDYLKSKLNYSCLQCGAEHLDMSWHCPNCKSWATVRQGPIVFNQK